MRTLLLLLVLIAALLGVVWVGGETLLARKVAQAIAEDPQLAAASVTELREGRRVGLGLTDVAVTLPEGKAALPSLALWVPPQRPNEIHATLPAEMTLTRGGMTTRLGAERAEITARLSPTRDLALSLGRIAAAGVTVDGAPLAEAVQIEARLTGYGAGSPRDTGAAYAVDGRVAGLALAGLTGGAIPDLAGGEGEALLWLDHLPTRATRGLPPPQLLGLRSDGVRLTLGDLSLTLRGKLVAGADGLAEGQVLIDSADTQALLARAADLGLVPRAAVPVATAALAALAAPTPSPAAEDTSAAREVRAAGLAVAPVPPPAAGELRLTLDLHDGKVHLGPLPIGPAPRLR